ncbi:MAG: hypothetical protein LBK26_03265 [Rickettsiales bacterium]|jgi:hypothetical protein|nr:hypothetical protein [Rickettsiales bacterium]
MKKILFVAISFSLLIFDAHAAPVTAKKTSVIASGTTIRQKVQPTGLFSQECYDNYFGCMDSFCTSDNESGGACACSDENVKYEKVLSDIETQLKNAENLRTIEVEKIQVGAKADIVFGGDRQYDAQGNVISLEKKENKANKEQKKLDLLSLWNDDNEDIWSSVESVAGKTGVVLYNAARGLCLDQMPDSCEKDQMMLTQLYATQVKNDCKAFDNAVKELSRKADAELASAQKDVRDARLASFEESNKLDRGTCLIGFKKCMMGPDVCGEDWSRCAKYVAAENMQAATVSTAKTKVEHIDKYGISTNTREMLDSKRNMCESILDQCVAVRDQVWPDFIRDIAPELKTAELNIESNMRQSCLTDISGCIQKACKDDIVGKGVDTMDSCLSRPDMARSFCKNQIDPCERMEPLIWGYVKDKLAAMRVDRCTEEVKECFTSDDRCGSDFMNCIGMDYKYMHEMCPVDKLVVCKQGNKDFSMSDIDNMLMGFYLNVDNSALENCQNIVNTKMMEICDSTTDCDKFATDENIGTSSLNSQKRGGIYSITGMLSFGQIKVGNGQSKVKDASGQEITLAPGKIDIQDYIAKVDALGVPAEYASVIDNVRYEMESIQGKINTAIDMIEQDPKIQYCITGRDLSQIKEGGGSTKGRFPNLLNQIKMAIAMSAIRAATDNYNKKFNELMAEATKSASTDVANLMCNKLPATNGSAQGIAASDFVGVISIPYAIVLEIAGVSNASIAAGGTHSSEKLGGAKMETKSGAAAGGSDGGATSTALGAAGAILTLNPAGMIADASVKAIGMLSSDHHKVEFEGGTKEMWSIFNRKDRNCHYCTLVIRKNCKTKGSRGFLGLWDSRGMECTEEKPDESCKDIPM